MTALSIGEGALSPMVSEDEDNADSAAGSNEPDEFTSPFAKALRESQESEDDDDFLNFGLPSRSKPQKKSLDNILKEFDRNQSKVREKEEARQRERAIRLEMENMKRRPSKRARRPSFKAEEGPAEREEGPPETAAVPPTEAEAEAAAKAAAEAAAEALAEEEELTSRPCGSEYAPEECMRVLGRPHLPAAAAPLLLHGALLVPPLQAALKLAERQVATVQPGEEGATREEVQAALLREMLVGRWLVGACQQSPEQCTPAALEWLLRQVALSPDYAAASAAGDALRALLAPAPRAGAEAGPASPRSPGAASNAPPREGPPLPCPRLFSSPAPSLPSSSPGGGGSGGGAALTWRAGAGPFLEGLRAHGYREAAPGVDPGDAPEGAGDASAGSGVCHPNTALLLQCLAVFCRRFAPGGGGRGACFTAEEVRGLAVAVARLWLDAAAAALDHAVEEAFEALLAYLPDRDWPDAVAQMSAQLAEQGSNHRSCRRLLLRMPTHTLRARQLKTSTCLLALHKVREEAREGAGPGPGALRGPQRRALGRGKPSADPAPPEPAAAPPLLASPEDAAAWAWTALSQSPGLNPILKQKAREGEGGGRGAMDYWRVHTAVCLAHEVVKETPSVRGGLRADWCEWLKLAEKAIGRHAGTNLSMSEVKCLTAGLLQKYEREQSLALELPTPTK